MMNYNNNNSYNSRPINSNNNMQPSRPPQQPPQQYYQQNGGMPSSRQNNNLYNSDPYSANNFPPQSNKLKKPQQFPPPPQNRNRGPPIQPQPQQQPPLQQQPYPPRQNPNIPPQQGGYGMRPNNNNGFPVPQKPNPMMRAPSPQGPPNNYYNNNASSNRKPPINNMSASPNRGYQQQPPPAPQQSGAPRNGPPPQQNGYSNNSNPYGQAPNPYNQGPPPVHNNNYNNSNFNNQPPPPKQGPPINNNNYMNSNDNQINNNSTYGSSGSFGGNVSNPYGGSGSFGGNVSNPYTQQSNPYAQSPIKQTSNNNNISPYQNNSISSPILAQQTGMSQVSHNGFENELVKQNTGAKSAPINNDHYNNGNYKNYDDAINTSLGNGNNINDGYLNDQTTSLPQRDLYKESNENLPDPIKNNKTPIDLSKPLDYNEYNNRKINAENNPEDSEIQLLWIKAIIEATQEHSLIISIDVNGNHLPNKLTSSKEIRKNRDVFLHKGLKRLKRLVSKDYSDAIYYLGTLYTNGKILEKNYDKAFDYYLKSANKGSGEGMYRVAICYEMGIGIKQDNQEAFNWFNKSSELRVVPAMFKLGMIFLKGTLNQRKSANKAIDWLEKAASMSNDSNPHSLFELGKLYEGFYPVSINNDLNIEDSTFLRELKMIIPYTDEEKALNLYIRAAKFNYPPAQSKLGWCYEYGKLGCKIDAKRSIGWYCRSASQGYALAEMALCGWYLTGSKGLLESNDKEAYLWALKAAEKGLSKAEYALGHFKETGLGTEKNFNEAKSWYKKAANQGHPKAIQRLEELGSL